MIESACPINRNYFGQGTEQSLALNLIGQVSLRSLFGLNCLFFDQLAISAPDLLGNPVLYELFNQEAKEMALLYRRRSEGGIGLIQPVLAGDLGSTEEVAESIALNDTIFTLPSKLDLEHHAQLISVTGPDYLWCDLPTFRINFYENILELVQHINLNGLTHPSASLSLSRGQLDKLLKWLRNTAPKDNLQCSAVFRFIDSHLAKGIQKKVKVLAESVYQFTSAQAQVAALSTASGVHPFVESLSTIQRYETSSPTLPDIFDYETVYTMLPIDKLAALPLRHLIKIRDLASFRKVRSLLASFRAGADSVTLGQIQNAVDECASQLVTYAEGNDLQRENFIQNIHKNKRILKLQVISNRLIPQARLLLFLIPSKTLAIVLGAVLNLASSKIAEIKTSQNAIHPESPATFERYFPAEGSQR